MALSAMESTCGWFWLGWSSGPLVASYPCLDGLVARLKRTRLTLGGHPCTKCLRCHFGAFTHGISESEGLRRSYLVKYLVNLVQQFIGDSDEFGSVLVLRCYMLIC